LISKATIDTVLKLRVEVIGDFVQLKRAGSNFKGFLFFQMNALLVYGILLPKEFGRF
jgi:hypothetical protein